MKRKKTSSAAKNPTAVVEAFLPDTEYVLDLDGVLILESLDSPFLRAEQPKLRDILLALLVMTDQDAVVTAKRKGKLEDLIRANTKGRRPAELLAAIPGISAAVQAAFAPLEGSGETETGKKK